ncbi:MAG: tRNA dihydrouridine synthase [Thermoguttaceae bacterium]
MATPLCIGPLKIDPPVLSAPMAGFSNYAYRRILRRFGGVGLLATEMLSARGFLHISERGGALPDRLWGVKDEPRPLAVQIWDNDPDDLAAVGKLLAEEFRVSVVDINFGCPARDVAKKALSGSFLLRYPDRVGEIVERVAKACRPTPVTAKIRLGWACDSINAIDVAQAVEQAGAMAICVHGRTAADGFRGRADWDEIAKIKPALKRISLIGNGDLKTPHAAVEAFRRYDVDGVMIGRAGLSRPWLFRQIHAALDGRPIPPEPSWEEQQELLQDFFQAMVEQFGPEKGTILTRPFACQYVQGRRGVRAFRREVSAATAPAAFLKVVEDFFPRR